MNRLSKSNIEYLDYSWSFASGCKHGETGMCPVGEFCWARKTTERFKAAYPKGFEPTIYPEALLSPLLLKKPARIGVCFMGDLFGDWNDPEMEVNPSDEGPIPAGESLSDVVFKVLDNCPQHTFIFLTKAPWNLPKWGPFPDNAWMGVSACDPKTAEEAGFWLYDLKARNKWISFEPLLERMAPHVTDYFVNEGLACIKLLVIGALTGTRKDMEAVKERWPALTLLPYRNQWTLQPPIEWVREIVEAADKAGAKVWIKNNLTPGLAPPGGGLFPKWARRAGPYLRQALPGE